MEDSGWGRISGEVEVETVSCPQPVLEREVWRLLFLYDFNIV